MSAKLEAVLSLAKRHDYDELHAHQVECLCGTLFMELQPLHLLADEDRKLLEYAAILHDIGHFYTATAHHKHALQIIMMEPFSELTRSEKLIIANTVRYHRKATPSERHLPYAILTAAEKKRVDMLAPLLRIADALDKSHRQVVRELSCVIEVKEKDKSVFCNIVTSGDALAEITSAETRSSLFKESFGYDFCVLAGQETREMLGARS